MLEKKRFWERVSSSALLASFLARSFSSMKSLLCSQDMTEQTVPTSTSEIKKSI